MAGQQPASILDAALPKSILKKYSQYGRNPPPQPPQQQQQQQQQQAQQPSSQPSSPGVRSRDEHHRQLALHHANLIQQRKDVETSIFAGLERMLDFPSAATTDPLQPAPEDIQQVQALMHPFQPSDFDSLVEERNIDGKCGYVLCPRPHKVEDTRGNFRLLSERGGGVDGFRIVKTADLERWCSETCGKHALYLRVQLSQTPAWERAGRVRSEIDIYGHGEEQLRQISGAATGDGEVEKLADGLDQLALERGDKAKNTFREQSMQIGLRERAYNSDIRSPAATRSGDYNIVDGYTPKSKAGRIRNHRGSDSRNEEEADGDDDDDVMDTI